MSDRVGTSVAVERARIAREIHDGPLQDAYAAQLELARLASLPGLPSTVAASIDVLRAAVEGTATEIRRVVDELRSRGGGQLGFSQRTAEHATRLAQRFGVVAVMDLKGLPELSSAVDGELGWIVQEAMTNAAKHAGACRVGVFGRRAGNGWLVSVTDDGPGFDVQATRTGFGLQSMAERAQLMGARLEVESQPGEGAEIRVVYQGSAS